MKELIRLNKVLARAGVCSRRKADRLIASGRVTVNGSRIIEPGTMIDPDKDRVAVQGREISPGSPDEAAWLILNKPVQVVTTVSDPQGRKTVMDFLPDKYRSKRLYPVGRLDYFSQGLIMLTNDGLLTHRLTHPSWQLPRVYELVVREQPGRDELDIMRRGMTLKDGCRLAPVKVAKKTSVPGRTTLELTLTQGVNRQIRRMCHDLGLTVLKLTRLSHGPISLGRLEPGRCRELSSGEIRALQKSTGLQG